MSQHRHVSVIADEQCLIVCDNNNASGTCSHTFVVCAGPGLCMLSLSLDIMKKESRSKPQYPKP
jgi:hypothetical protein